MRMKAAFLSLVLAAAPVLTLERGTLGFALGTKNPDGSCKVQSDYEDDFDAIKRETGATLMRGYSASDCDCAKNILPAAKAKGFKVGALALRMVTRFGQADDHPQSSASGPMSTNPSMPTKRP